MKPRCSLTEEQELAVSTAGAIYVEACPGAGKTRIIVDRFIHVAGKCGARRGVAVLTFTNAATEEVRSRCAERGRGNLVNWPHFVGTMDSFVARFLAVPFSPGERRPRILESWDQLDIPISIRGVTCPPVPLSAFDFGISGAASLDLDRLRQIAPMVRPFQDKLETSATRKRASLIHAGFLTPADVRMLAAGLVRNETANPLAIALKHRFSEVIVDEAQDCNDEDWEVLGWLKNQGVPVVIVADPHQAIYEFRNSLPEKLTEFTKSLLPRPLTGNFRSTPVICAVATTFRPGRPADRALGDMRAFRDPVLLIPHDKVDRSIGESFISSLDALGLSAKQAVIIAHARKDARRAAGIEEDENMGTGRSGRLHAAVSTVVARQATARERLGSLTSIERLLLQLGLGEKSLSGHIDDACENRGVSRRWLRRAALALVEGLHTEIVEQEPAVWNKAAQTQLRGLDWPSVLPEGRSCTLHASRKALSSPASSVNADLRADTVHGVKGQEFDAVLLVLPRATSGRKSILDAWKAPNGQESLRVGYVAVTRARRVLALSPPRAEINWVRNRLREAGVPFTPPEVAPTGQMSLFGDAP